MKPKTLRSRLRSHTDPLLLLSFLIPFLGMLAVLLIGKCEPFGNDKALLYSDEYHQYYPFFVGFRKALLSGQSLLYSWDVGMGMDYLGLVSYYLGSPLNLLSILVPEDLTLEYFALLSPIKLGLAGLFFAYFLKKTFHSKDWAIPFFGGAYALCAWALGYQWNVMWLDTFALLPLVALGTIQLLRDKRSILYTVSLFFSVFINYYIGFFTCIFVLLSFICYEICRFQGFKRFFLDLCRIALFSLLAIGMTAVLELPTLAALQNTQSSVNEFPTSLDLNIVDYQLCLDARATWDVFNNAIEAGEPFASLVKHWFNAMRASVPLVLDGMRQAAGNMGGGIYPSFKEGLPNLYCGVGTLFLAALFLTSKDVKLRDKICSVAMLLFLLLSFVIRQLDYIWHGFHFPNMIPYRFSFLYSFVLLYMAFRAWLVRDRFKLWQIITAMVLSVGIILCSEELTEPVYMIFNFVLIAVYLAVIIGIVIADAISKKEQRIAEQSEPEQMVAPSPLCHMLDAICTFLKRKSPLQAEGTILEKNERVRKQMISAAFCAVMMVELILNLVGFGARFPSTTVKNYPSGTKYTASIVRYMYEREKGSDFFRAETTHAQTLNDGALNGYDGISTFTSSANVRVTKFMQMLGYGAKDTYNRYCFEESSPVANLFLNLKYMLERDADVEDNSYFDMVHAYGSVFLLENNAYLPLGFLAEPGLKETSLDQIDEGNGTNAFFKQNYLFKQATGLEEPVWNMVHGSRLSIVGSKSLELIKANNATGYTKYNTTTNAATLRYTYTFRESGFLCLDLNMYRRNSYKVYKNDQELFSETMSLPQMIAICDVKPEDKITVDITCKSGQDGVVLIRAALLDDEVFRKGHEILSRSTLDLTKMTNTHIKGTIDCDRDGLLYTSIPYDGNWVAKVDGKKVEPVLVGDAMMALELTEGEHTVSFRYRNDAFIIGLIISLVCLSIFLALILVPRYIRKNQGKYLK